MAPPTPSLLDFTQILQRVLDEANGRLRVDSSATVVAGSIDCVISHEDDSIRLGDGTSLVTTTTIGSDVALDVNIINAVSGATTVPFIENLVIASANTEVSLSIPNNTQNLIIKPRSGRLQLAFSSGESSTKYLTISKGGNYVLDNLKTSSLTLYLQSSVAGDIVEVHGWST